MTDRLLFPETGFTKSDAVRYYRAVGRFMLPHIKNRPVSFKRYVDTIHGESFWEKDAPSFTPEWVTRVAVPRRGEGEADLEYIVIKDTKTLAWIAGVGGIEIHPFLHTANKIHLATHVVFDLDPGEGADIVDCAKVALLLRDALAGIRLESFAKVSGSKGIQVYVPIKPAPHEVTEPFARVVADELARAHPKRIVSKMAKSLRAGKVFIDWSQNADYKTTVAVYSLRAKSDVPYVSMPVRWDELARPKKSALSWEPDAALARLRKVGDLFAPMLRMRQRLWTAAAQPPLSPRKRQLSPPHSKASLPKPSSQSGRRLFVLTKHELLLDMHGKFKRWMVREGALVPAGDVPIDRAWYRGEAPSNVRVEDIGAYEIIEGSYARGRFDLWFNGNVLSGAWILEKGSAGWRFSRG